MFLIGGAVGEEAKKSDDRALTKTAHARNDDATLTVYYPATFYIVAPKPVRVVIENTGKRNLVYFSPEVEDGFLFTVTDGDGKAVPRTRYGKTLPTEPRNWWDGKVGRVGPGQKFEVELDPMRAFDMTMAGSYKLNLSVRRAFYVNMPGDNLAGGSTVYSNFSVEGIRLDVKERPLADTKKGK